MSIPSDPTQPPPSHSPKHPPSAPQNQFPAKPLENAPTPTSYMDPTGAWAKFLSTPGHAASAEEVKLFLQSLLKMFNVLIQQQNQAAQRANQKLKEAIEGDD